VADIKEKNYEEEGAGAGAAWLGLVWFGLVWFGFFQLTLTLHRVSSDVRCITF
jgi:hypothetical protein